MPPTDVRKALLLNKRTVARIEIPPAHKFASLAGGWRIDFSATGEIRVVGESGANDTITVGSGDFLLATGEDYYLSRLVAGGGA